MGTSPTPAPAQLTVKDLYDQLQKTCGSIDGAKNALADKLAAATPAKRQHIQSEILSMSIKEGQLQGAFLRESAHTDDYKLAIVSIKATTDQLEVAAKQIVDVDHAIQTATKMLGYITGILSALAPLIAL